MDLIENVLARFSDHSSGLDGASLATCPSCGTPGALGIAGGKDHVVLKCYRGCSRDQVLADAEMVSTDIAPRGEPDGVTVNRLAFEKRLPKEWLRLHCGVADDDGERRVIIPYLDDKKNLLYRRVRSAVKAKDGSSYESSGITARLYGLWQRDEFLARGRYVVVVEGETDAWVLWHHGINAFGVPGATVVSAIHPGDLDGFDVVYIWQESDAAGLEFPSAVGRRLREIGFTGEIKMVSHPSVKDPADLHARDPGAFPDSFRKILDSATVAIIKSTVTSPPVALKRPRREVSVQTKASRCTRYTAQIPEAIIGQGGRKLTHRVACVIAIDFDLPGPEGYAEFQKYNARLVAIGQGWSEKDLRREWEGALKRREGKCSNRIGCKLIDRRPSRKRTAAARSATVAVAKVQSEANQNGSSDQEFEDTDIGHAKRYLSQRDELRYAADQKAWYVWDGRRWFHDNSEAFVEQCVKEHIVWMTEQAAKRIAAASKVGSSRTATESEKSAAVAELKRADTDLQRAIRLQSVKNIRNIIAILRSERRVVVQKYADVFDRDPWAFNAANGTIDLSTGTLRPHRQADYITKLSPVAYDPDAKAPRYREFLDSIFRQDESLIGYARGLSGVCVTGDVSEHMLNVFFGDGSNGKGTLIEGCWLPVMGDYGMKIAETVLVNNGRDQHPTERADLAGVRLAIASETKQESKLDEARVKELTGGDTVAARKMRQDFFRFAPTHKLILLTNHRPKIEGTDHGIWRRIRLVPFDVQFWRESDRLAKPQATYDPALQADPTLVDKLKAEAPGILADMVKNAVEFFRSRTLIVPQKIAVVTKEYRDLEDVVAQFVSEKLTLLSDESGKMSGTEIYQYYHNWSERLGLETMSSKKFGVEIKKHVLNRKSGGLVYFAKLKRDSDFDPTGIGLEK